MVKDIEISAFDYPLPEDKIARHPLAKRDECKLLLYRPDGIISHRVFKELPDLLPPGSILVCNDTKVINARLQFFKETGARIEIFLLEPVEPSDYSLMFQSRGKCKWRCLVGNLKKWKNGLLSMTPGNETEEIFLTAEKSEADNEEGEIIEFKWKPVSLSFAEIIDRAGNIPIPPYLNRETEERDIIDYQTVYAFHEGSVAAPTAGLHFTDNVMDSLTAHNIPVEKLTLHVGAGTFKPVKEKTIGAHQMHTEVFSVSERLIETLIKQKKEGKPVVAVGTTTVRTLESLPLIGYKLQKGDFSFHIDQWEAYELPPINPVEALCQIIDYMHKQDISVLTATTSIMIAPGFKWNLTDIMVTNFHQPQSTLLLLVSSFLDNEKNGKIWKEIYKEALQNDYRFLSYGDACLFFRP